MEKQLRLLYCLYISKTVLRNRKTKQYIPSMKVMSYEKKWLRIGLTLLIAVLSFGTVKALIPAIFLKKVIGNVQEIAQKYSAEGDKKLIVISFTKQHTLQHVYVNKDYLPNPQLAAIKDQTQLVTYVAKGGGDTFYGLELANGTVIQSKRWDLLTAYLNHSVVVFVLTVVPIGLYFMYRKELVQNPTDRVLSVVYMIVLAFVWGKLHIFLMILLILGLVQIGKKLSKQKPEQAVNDIDLPTQT